MAGKINLGEFEIVVLAAISRVGEDSYGVRLCEEIKRRTGREVSVGAMYTTLYRLEKKGLLSSRTGTSTPTRGGRAKRYFRLEGEGRSALRTSLNTLAKMTNGIIPGMQL